MSRAECAAVQARFHFVGMWRSGTCGWHVRQRSSPLFRRPLGEPRSSPGHQAPCSRLGPLRTTNPHVSSTRIMYNESARLAFLANQISTLLNEIRSAARPGARPPRPGGKRQAHTSRAGHAKRVRVSRNHVPDRRYVTTVYPPGWVPRARRPPRVLRVYYYFGSTYESRHPTTHAVV